MPFHLNIKEKVTFFFILLLNILLIIYLLGNLGAIFLIISSCIYIAIIRNNRLQNICTFIIIYLFCVLCDNAFSLLWDFIYPISKLQNSKYYIIYISSYIFLLLFICPIINKFISYLRIQIQTNIQKDSLILITINLFICLFIFLFNIIIGDYIGYNRQIITFNCILFGCYFLLSTIMIINVIKANYKQMENNIKQESYNRLQEYTNQIENLYSSLRSFKHDYLNVMLSMSGYIETGDINGLQTYFEKEINPLNKTLFSNTSCLNQLINIKSIELKSIISAKLLYATELNINVSVEISDEIYKLYMDIVDLSRVLGIYLDNAIEATLETNAPTIRFAIIDSKSEYIFIIINTFIDAGIHFTSFDKPVNSKKGPNHGIGLYNAYKICSKYNHVFQDTEIKDSLFIQRLLIKK